MVTICKQEDHLRADPLPPSRQNHGSERPRCVLSGGPKPASWVLIFVFKSGRERLVYMVENLALGAGERNVRDPAATRVGVFLALSI